MKYYNLHEITEEGGRHGHGTVYTDESGEKFYTLNWGTMIAKLGPDGKTILNNTEIEGVVEAETDEEAALKLGVHPLLAD